MDDCNNENNAILNVLFVKLDFSLLLESNIFVPETKFSIDTL